MQPKYQTLPRFWEQTAQEDLTMIKTKQKKNRKKTKGEDYFWGHSRNGILQLQRLNSLYYYRLCHIRAKFQKLLLDFVHPKLILQVT